MEKPSFGDQKKDEIFQAYFDKYWDNLVLFSLKFIKDRDLAEDIVQEVYHSFWQRLENLKDWSRLESYLYRSTKNRTINALKKNSQRVFEHALELNDSILASGRQDSTLESELVQAMHKSIAALPQRRRMIFKMKTFQRYSNDDISMRLNISVHTVKSQFTKAINHIRDDLKPLLSTFLVILLLQ